MRAKYPSLESYDSKYHYVEEQLTRGISKNDFIELPQGGTFIPVPAFAG